MLRGAACSIGTVAYFNPGGSSTVYCYNYLSKQWIQLPASLLTNQFALVVISDLLTAVGGTRSNKLFTFNGEMWMEKYPPMTTKRASPAAVCSDHSLVVAGGRDEQRQHLMTVEVMDTNTLQWSTAASLPRGIYYASMTACGDDLYLLGDDTTHVYSCSLQSLLQSCQAPGKASASQQTSIWNRITGRVFVSSSQQTSVWNRVADLPVLWSTAVTLFGKLVSIGGVKDKGAVDSVYCYNPTICAWKVIGSIPSSESRLLVTTLPGDKLIMVYGDGDITIAVASAVVS